MDKSKRGKTDYEDGTHIDKTQVLQEAKQCFMANSVDTKRLVETLTKCIFILFQGEKLASNEATDLFFHITRLFQYKGKDSTLRRLMYIGIKALSQQAENVYVVTSSLTTDVNSSKDDPAVRASALRALCQISDASTFTSIERYLRQSIVDKHPVVASAALTSLVRIGQVNPEIVKRCTNEIQEALKSESPMVQYHALGLRYNSCRKDKLAVSRLINNCIQQGLQSDLATCLLIRIITNYLNENGDEKSYLDYVKLNLYSISDMVKYEASNAYVDLNNLHTYESSIASSNLIDFLSSSKPSLRFAAVRSLNKMANRSPKYVVAANLKLETLLSQSDCNRSIAILAITTLLKTGTEKSVEKFLKQIGEFLSEIDDEFKVIVVGSVRQLCQKYPSKHVVITDFLSHMLREDGGFAYKKAIIDTIIKIIEDNEESKEKGLEILCDFIEDCEHVDLTIEVLNLLGREGPKTKKASTYIRFIANRLLLDKSPVACAATAALAKFGTVPELSDSIKTALDRFSLHEDYEVLERAVFYKNILDFNDTALNEKFITDTGPKVSYSDLEVKLMKYLSGDCAKPFNFSDVALAGNDVTKTFSDSIRDDDIDNTSDVASSKPDKMQPSTQLEVFDDIDLGDLIISSEPKPLTDSVSEFGVQCTSHVYERHIVFQLDCTNTVNCLRLENVKVELSPPEGFCVLASTEYSRLAFDETASIYLCVEVADDNSWTIAYFTNVTLKYNYRTVDPETSEPDGEDVNEDTFLLEDIVIDLGELT